MSDSSGVHVATSVSAADIALAQILEEISVPMPVLEEAKSRRNRILAIAEEHDAARDGAGFASGSVAHGTTNRPLEDADCGIKVNRRFEAFRAFGPDGDEDRGPEAFIRLFSEFILPRFRQQYPRAEVDLEGNRAIKFLCNETVQIDEWGPVDPYVELIVGLDRADGPGIWIPSRRRRGWDAADPELHTELMTARGSKALRVLRAHTLRLAKRAVKRDAANGGMAVMYSWNLSALGYELVTETDPIGVTLWNFFRDAAVDIAEGLTEDPAPSVVEPIKLPDHVTREMAAARLEEMAAIVEGALGANTIAGARAHLAGLFGEEIKTILAREERKMNRGLRAGDASAVASALGVAHAPKPTRSGGA
jgi:hypothetical protein